MAALNANNKGRGLHLIEPSDLEFSIHSIIAPAATSLTPFKVSGKLPSLVANFSDLKYKGILRLVDVVIPKFDGADSPLPALPTFGPDPFKPLSNFLLAEEDYGVEGGDDCAILGDEDKRDQGDSVTFLDGNGVVGQVSRAVKFLRVI